jgi:hypothetical protein
MFFKIDIESNQHSPMTKQKSAKNFSIIFFLGIASGLPLALILSTLKALLLEKGFDDKINLDSLNREELARFIVANRDTPEGIEARRIYIRRLAKKVENCGTKFYQLQ